MFYTTIITLKISKIHLIQCLKLGLTNSSLGVSLDGPGQQAAWIQAIKQDGLVWTQVSDLKGRQNDVAKMYGVLGIPANFLIAPDGKIIGKNLRGEFLVAEFKTLSK